MRIASIMVTLLTAAGLWASSACADAPRERSEALVASTLQRYGIPREGWSIYVQEVGASEPILAVDEDLPRNPASTMKLLTTLVGLEELGPAYTWKTEAYAVSPVKNGRLEGDLYLKGYGDPYLVTESFWTLLNGLRNLGLRHITGDLVLDGSYLQPEPTDASSFDGQPWRAYNVQPAALLVNFQSVHLRFLPDPASARLRIIADPRPHNVAIENSVRLTKGPCRGGWGRRLRTQVRHVGDEKVIRFTGQYPAACGEREMYRVLSDAAHHVYGVFKSLWIQQGGIIDGGLHEAVLPEESRLLHAVESRPLADLLRGINKYSNNVMTRQVVLTLGASRLEPPGTTDKGLAVVRGWLARAGLHFPELVLENGAGLSRDERISARHLGQVLLKGYTSRYMAEFMSSLPIAGLDGTLQKRFTDSALVGRLHAKTGSLNNVRSLAGYMLDRQGRRLVVVLLHNHATANTPASEQVQEALLQWLYDRP